MLSAIQLNETARYISMRVHGTDAHVDSDMPDLPVKQVWVRRMPVGTLVTSNYNAYISVHISIPTPLSVERTVPSVPRVLARRIEEDVDVTHVFEGASIWVEQVALYLGRIQIGLDYLELYDGGRRIFHSDLNGSPLIPAQSDPYAEPPNKIEEQKFVFQVERRLYSGLGMTFTGGFRNFEHGENQLLIHAAKAVFYISQ